MDLRSINWSELKDWRKLLQRKRERLGLELEGRAIRIVRMERSDAGGYRIGQYESLDIDLKHATAMEQQRFKAAIKQVGNGLQRVAVNMEHPTLRIRRMIFAKMPDRDLVEAIRWNFREHVEVPIEKYVVSYTPLEEMERGNRMAVMGYGVSEEAVAEYVGLMKKLGLKAISLEPSSTALLAAFHANDVLLDGRYHVCIAFGEVTTQFIVMKDNAMVFSRPLAGINYDALVRLLMRNLNMNEQEAAEAFVGWIQAFAEGAEVTPSDLDANVMRRIETTMGHFLSQLVIESQRSIDAFCIMYSVEAVDVIHVCGLVSSFPRIMSHMERTLGIETKVFNPFEKLLSPEEQTEEVLRQAPLFAVAVGLAIP